MAGLSYLGNQLSFGYHEMMVAESRSNRNCPAAGPIASSRLVRCTILCSEGVSYVAKRVVSKGLPDWPLGYFVKIW
jgi:hypothetical protein